MKSSFLPVLTVVGVLFALWYAAAVWLNADWTYDKATRSGETVTATSLVADTWAQKKPKLPAPHQVASEIWDTTVMKKVTSKRSLVYHSWITLSATLLGFGMGTLLGVLLAVGIVFNRVMDMSVMPWVIASQTIPILAIAPMIIVVLNAVGVSGLLPKAMISMYLSFFPVVVGMVKVCAALIRCSWTRCAPGMPVRARPSGSCGCLRRCRISLPRSRSRWLRRWWGPSLVSCQRVPLRVWGRGCWLAATMARRSRSGAR